MSPSHEIIVAAYDTPAHAELAIADLLAAGLPEDRVGRHLAKDGEPVEPAHRGFWARLLGGHGEHGSTLYDRTVGDGGTVVSVYAPPQGTAPDGDRIAAILAEHAPVDLDERAARHAASPSTEGLPLFSSPLTAGIPFDTSIVSDALDIVAIGRAAQLIAERSLVDRGNGRVRRYVEAVQD